MPPLTACTVISPLLSLQVVALTEAVRPEGPLMLPTCTCRAKVQPLASLTVMA